MYYQSVSMGNSFLFLMKNLRVSFSLFVLDMVEIALPIFHKACNIKHTLKKSYYLRGSNKTINLSAFISYHQTGITKLCKSWLGPQKS